MKIDVSWPLGGNESRSTPHVIKLWRFQENQYEILQAQEAGETAYERVLSFQCLNPFSRGDPLPCFDLSIAIHGLELSAMTSVTSCTTRAPPNLGSVSVRGRSDESEGDPERYPWNIISRVSPTFSWLSAAKCRQKSERESREKGRSNNTTDRTSHRHVNKAQPSQERSYPHHSFSFQQRQVLGLGFIFPCDHSSLIPLTHPNNQSIAFFTTPISLGRFDQISIISP